MAAAYVWPVVLVGRVVDRLGKGVRSAPRDALIAASVPREDLGRAFGFHRAGDTLGAVIGPLIALVGLALLDGDVRAVLWWAVVPAVASVLLTFLVVERRRTPEAQAAPAPAVETAPVLRSPLPRAFWRVTLVLVGIAVVNFPDALLLLRVSDLGFSTTQVVLAYVVYNLVYALGSYPAGALSDRLPRPLVYGLGLLAFAVAYAGLGLVDGGPWVFVLVAVYGLFPALTDGVGKAWISTLVGDEHRGPRAGRLPVAEQRRGLPGRALGRAPLDRRARRRRGAAPGLRRARAGRRARARPGPPSGHRCTGGAHLGWAAFRGSGGTGRHAGFRFLCFRACGFKSRLPHSVVFPLQAPRWRSSRRGRLRFAALAAPFQRRMTLALGGAAARAR